MKKNPRRRAGQFNGKSCSVEALEGRQLLSAAFIEAGGRLVVRGTTGNDNITISRNPSNSSQIRALVNGQAFDFTSKYVTQVRVEAGSGNDFVQSDVSKGSLDAPMFFLGDSGNDTLLSTSADDCLIGGGDADVIVAKAGSNYVNGGAGNDRIFAGTGNDTLIGETGTDYFSDAGGTNSLPDHVSGEMVVKAAVPTTIPSATGALPVVAPSAVTPTPSPTPTTVSQPPELPSPVLPATSSANPFVIGVWSQPYWSFDKWKARGINTVVGYESMGGTVSVEKFSTEAVNRGLFMIRHPNADPTKDVGQKNLLAWMQNDEPDYHNTPASTVQAEYNRLKAVDPKMPVFVNFSGSSSLWGYGGKTQTDYQNWMKGADWVSNDLYPVTAHNRPWALDAPGQAVAELSQWSGGKRQFAVIEASDQDLAPHPEYPGVNADQFRSEVFNAVIRGATGIIYFPQRIGGGFLYDNMNASVEAEMKSVNARLSSIGNALMTQKDPSTAGITVGGTLRATWRQYNGKTYFIVLNNSTSAVTATMSTKGVSASSASVDGESRSVAISGGQITDTFKAMEAHVYVV